jgi:acyl-CoA thioesterase-1
MRICFFGDSFVNGTGDDDGLGWVGRLVAEARQAGRDVTGYNLGIRGDTSAAIAARWKNEARLRLPPEHAGYLMFSFGANDCIVKESNSKPSVEHSRSLAHAEAILHEAQSWLPTLMIGPGIIADDMNSNARICSLSADYQRLCERIGVPYLELCHLLLQSSVWTKEALAGDGAHPNRNGYTIAADAVRKWHYWREWMTASS